MSGYGIFTLISNPANVGGKNVVQGASVETLLPTGINTNQNSIYDATAAPVYPTIKRIVQAEQDKNIYIAADGKGYMNTDPSVESVYSHVVTLPIPVDSVRSLVVTTGQTPSGASKTYMALLSHNDTRIWYSSSDLKEYKFGGWTQVSITLSPVFKRRYFMTSLYSMGGLGLIVCGRFEDEAGKHYGIAQAKINDFQVWEVMPNSKFSEVNGSISYARGVAILQSGDLYMYGKILNDERSNLYAVNVLAPFHNYTDPVMDMPGVEEMCDLVELKDGGRVGLVVPSGSTYGSFLGCSTSQPGPPGAAKVFAFWSASTNRWDRLPDAIDPTKNIALGEMAVVSPNFATDYQLTNFVLAVKCTEAYLPNATIYYINVVPSATSIDQSSIRIDRVMIDSATTANINQTLTMAMLTPVFSTYPINITGVSPIKITPRPGGGGGAKPDPDPFGWLKSKWTWIGFGAVFLLIVGVLYYNMVQSIGKRQTEVKKLMEAYLSTPVAPAAPPPVVASPTPVAAPAPVAPAAPVVVVPPVAVSTAVPAAAFGRRGRF